MSDEQEIKRPTTALGLGPVRNQALKQQEPPPDDEPIEPVPEDFAQRVGLPDNDAPLPRDTAIMNLDVVWRSSDDDLPPEERSKPQQDDPDDLEDSLLGEGPLPEDDLPEDSEDFIIPRTAHSHERPVTRVEAHEPPKHAPPAPQRALSERQPPASLPEIDTDLPSPSRGTTLLPLLIVILGLVAGYVLASALLDACS